MGTGRAAELSTISRGSTAIAHGLDTSLRYTLPIPKWQFLCYLADEHQFALHGSGDGNIQAFEPRQPSDVTTFGNQRAVYAAADGLWPMYVLSELLATGSIAFLLKHGAGAL